jgi:hypothetical protein
MVRDGGSALPEAGAKTPPKQETTPAAPSDLNAGSMGTIAASEEPRIVQPGESFRHHPPTSTNAASAPTPRKSERSPKAAQPRANTRL